VDIDGKFQVGESLNEDAASSPQNERSKLDNVETFKFGVDLSKISQISTFESNRGVFSLSYVVIAASFWKLGGLSRRVGDMLSVDDVTELVEPAWF